MEKLRRRCETLDGEIKEQWKFKEFYQFTFNFAKNPGQKSLGGWVGTNKTPCPVCCCNYVITFFFTFRIGNGNSILEHCNEGAVQILRHLVYISKGIQC